MNATRLPLTIVISTMLALASAGPVSAQNPAGYERMRFPTADYAYHLGISPSWAQEHSAVSTFGVTKGYRIIDLEIDSFYMSPGLGERHSPYHAVSVVEVPNDGAFACESWGVVLGETERRFDWYLDKMNWRPIDIELYYRHDPFTGDMTATYAYVGVENTGDHFAEWARIPPMPLYPFLAALDERYTQSWRPYDVEFAYDESGTLVGTALLASNLPLDPSDTSTLVPTMWTFFDASELQVLGDLGWQLLDAEVTPKIHDPDNPFGYGEFPPYFGVFVDTSFIQEEDTETAMEIEHTADEVDGLSVHMDGAARIVDIERDGTIPGSCSKDVCEGDMYTYLSVWLFEP